MALEWAVVAQEGAEIPLLGPAAGPAKVDHGRFVLPDPAQDDLLPAVLRIEEPRAIPERERDGKGPVLRADVEHGQAVFPGGAVHLAILGEEGPAVPSVLDLIPT